MSRANCPIRQSQVLGLPKLGKQSRCVTRKNTWSGVGWFHDQPNRANSLDCWDVRNARFGVGWFLDRLIGQTLWTVEARRPIGHWLICWLPESDKLSAPSTFVVPPSGFKHKLSACLQVASSTNLDFRVSTTWAFSLMLIRRMSELKVSCIFLVIDLVHGRCRSLIGFATWCAIGFGANRYTNVLKIGPDRPVRSVWPKIGFYI